MIPYVEAVAVFAVVGSSDGSLVVRLPICVPYPDISSWNDGIDHGGMSSGSMLASSEPWR